MRHQESVQIVSCQFLPPGIQRTNAQGGCYFFGLCPSELHGPKPGHQMLAGTLSSQAKDQEVALRLPIYKSPVDNIDIHLHKLGV